MLPRAAQLPEPFPTIPAAAKNPVLFAPGASTANLRCRFCRWPHSTRTAPRCPRSRTLPRGLPRVLRLFRRIPRPDSPRVAPLPLVPERPDRLFSARASPPAPAPRGVRLDNSLWAHQRSCTLLFPGGGLILDVGFTRSEIHWYQKEDP